MIWAFDLATATGWAIGRRRCGASPEVVLSGVWNLAPRRGDSPGMRFVLLRRRLEELRSAYTSPALVVFERAHHRGGPATEVGVGLMTHLMGWCAEHGIEHTAVHTGTLKKSATGSGSAKKPQMCAAASGIAGREIVDDNEADAICLLGVEL